MPNDQLQRLAVDLLEAGDITPDQLRSEIETAIERVAAHLADDADIRYFWQHPDDTDPPERVYARVDEASAAEHHPDARLVGYDERAGFRFDVESYGLGTSRTVKLRIHDSNLRALRIPVDAVDRPRQVFLVEVAPGTYRLGGRYLHPARPITPAQARREARAA